MTRGRLEACATMLYLNSHQLAAVGKICGRLAASAGYREAEAEPRVYVMAEKIYTDKKSA